MSNLNCELYVYKGSDNDYILDVEKDGVPFPVDTASSIKFCLYDNNRQSSPIVDKVCTINPLWASAQVPVLLDSADCVNIEFGVKYVGTLFITIGGRTNPYPVDAVFIGDVRALV
jgi:hypothetical protein